MTRFAEIWRVPDGQVASGRIPGWAGAVRIGEDVEVRAGGCTAVDGGTPVAEDTLFRIASITKPIGAALALSLVRDGVLALDDPIGRWLPEAAEPRVLERPDAPLDATVAAPRPVTVRHLLTLTSGWGAVLTDSPLQRAMIERDVYPGSIPAPLTADEWVARTAALPLAFAPGEGWLYDTGMELLGVLLTRATGRSLARLLAERITGPLGMADTGFGTASTDRLATAYRPGPDGLVVLDPPDGAFDGPPRFERLSSGLVSTAPDLLRFFCAMADGGAPVLSPGEVALMTADALTAEQRHQAAPIVGPGASWGMGTGVDIEAAEPWMAPGRWGWNGGIGTTAHVDPSRACVAVLLTQREMTGPLDAPRAFWAAVAAVAGTRAR